MCFPPLHAVERKVDLGTQQETGTSDGYCIFPKFRQLLTALPHFFLFKEDCEVMRWDMLSRCLLLLHDTVCLVLSSSQHMQPFPVLRLLEWWKDSWELYEELEGTCCSGERITTGGCGFQQALAAASKLCQLLLVKSCTELSFQSSPDQRGSSTSSAGTGEKHM